MKIKQSKCDIWKGIERYTHCICLQNVLLVYLQWLYLKQCQQLWYNLQCLYICNINHFVFCACRGYNVLLVSHNFPYSFLSSYALYHIYLFFSCFFTRGLDFRPAFRQLTVLGSLFPDVPLVALTATATRRTQNTISQILGLKTPVKILGNVDRPIIFIGKYRRGPQRLGVGSFGSVLKPIAEQLKVDLTNYPLTIIDLPLKWCRAAYNLFCEILGNFQYFCEGCARVPQNRLFAQYRAPHWLKEWKGKV